MCVGLSGLDREIGEISEEKKMIQGREIKN